jgi:hypothetical protein
MIWAAVDAQVWHAVKWLDMAVMGTHASSWPRCSSIKTPSPASIQMGRDLFI